MAEGGSPYFFTGLGVEGSSAFIRTSAGEIEIAYDKETGKVTVLDPSKNPVEASSITPQSGGGEGKTASYSMPGVGDFVIETVEGAFAFKMREIAMVFAIGQDGAPVPLSRVLEPVDLDKEVPAMGFKGMEFWATSRGYIWSRSIPLMLERLIIGSGPDTFSLVFPQGDVGGKMAYMGNPYIVVDKPHNMYMQIGVNTGLLSLLAYLAMFAVYALSAFPQAAKGRAVGEEPWVYGLRLGIFVGVCGYMAAALSTDSTVSVSPIFWIVFGMGFALSKRAARLRAGGVPTR
jgi:hypothetical protein